MTKENLREAEENKKFKRKKNKRKKKKIL